MRLRIAVLSLALGLAVVSGPARAQGGQGTYFYGSGTHLINTDLSGHDVVIGAAPAGGPVDWGDILLPGAVATIANGAVITNDGDPSDGITSLYTRSDSQVTMTGGSVERWGTTETSSGRLLGGSVGTVWMFYDNTFSVEGGSVGTLQANYTRPISISGGSVSFVDTTKSKVYISGGSVSFLRHNYYQNSFAPPPYSTITMTGGTVSNVQAWYTNFLLSGGNAGNVDLREGGTGAISGGTFSSLTLGSTIRMFGTNLRLENYRDVFGVAHYNLYGTLRDGTVLTGQDVALYQGVELLFNDQGGTQSNPILPSGYIQPGQGATPGNGMAVFTGVPSGAWYDPPLTEAFDFAMQDGDLFTSILDFPSATGDVDNLFTVSVAGVTLGEFAPGQSVNFADYGFAGGVSSFRISGINPGVETGNDTAFPIKLAFSSPLGSFTMAPANIVGSASAAPEPGSLALLGLLAPFGMLHAQRHRRK